VDFQANAGIVPQFDRDLLLPNPWQVITLESFYHLTLYVLDTEGVVK
jgi:hypothetical protein